IRQEKEAHANSQGVQQRKACVEKRGYGAESLTEALLCLGRYTTPRKLSEAGHGLFLSHQRPPGTEKIQHRLRTQPQPTRALKESQVFSQIFRARKNAP